MSLARAAKSAWLVDTVSGTLLLRLGDGRAEHRLEGGVPAHLAIVQREMRRTLSGGSAFTSSRGWLQLAHALLGASADGLESRAPAKRKAALSRFEAALERGLRTGRLRAERVPEHLPAREVSYQIQLPELPAGPAPETRSWIGVKVVDQDGEPVPFRAFRLRLSDESTREGFLDDAGYARIDGVSDGPCTVTFPDLDATARRMPTAKGGTLTDEEGPVRPGEGSGLAHLVEDGETLSSIASRYGFFHYETLWNDESNGPLRARRDDPHALLPGDTVWIPERRAMEARCSAGAEHTFHIFRNKLYLRLRFLDTEEQPRRGLTCTVTVDGESQEIATDGDGILEALLPPEARTAEVLVDDEVIPVALGGLHPLSERTGVGGRLRNAALVPPLAHLTIDDEPALGGELLVLGTERLQKREGSTPDGKWTRELRGALRRAAGV